MSDTQFRIMVGSYEHNLMCLSLLLGPQPIFQPIFHFQAHTLSIKSIDLAKRYLVTGSNDEHIRIYDMRRRKELGTLLSHQGTITSLRFSTENADDGTTEKSGKWLLSGSEDGKIIIWRTKDWEPFGTLKGHQLKVNDVAIHPSGRVAISVSQDQTVRLWNLMTAKKAAVLKLRGKDHLGECGESVRWSVDGKNFAVGLLTKVFLYQLSPNTEIVKKLTFKSTLMCMEILKINDKEWLITGHSNGAVDFYDLQELLASEDETLDESKRVFQLRGHTNRIKGLAYINHAVETKGVPYLITVSSDGKIVVWNLSEDVRDQVAVYDSGERLNCVVACPESIEKETALKRTHTEAEYSESEYETDGEEARKLLKGKRKNRKNKKRVTVTLED